MSRLKLSLYDNAVGFAEDALSNAVIAEEAPERWKFAILSLTQAIELSLKELLRLQHPLFIYRNIDNPDQTVGITQAKNRLHKIAGVQLEDSENNALKTASEIRNRIVHHEVDEAVSDLKLTFARLLGFLNEFHRTHFEDSLQELIDEELWGKGAKISEYGEELYRRAKDRLASEDLDDPSSLITCPKCSWEALAAFGANECTCYVCGHVEDLVICARCDEIMIYDDHEHEVSGKKPYCRECYEYISDDYWHERAAGK